MSGIVKHRQVVYDALPKRPLPGNFKKFIRQAQEAAEKLKAESARFDAVREFTLDGRFLGDIGEISSKIHFGVSLHQRQLKSQDGHHNKTPVEVKLRSNSDLIEFKNPDETALLLVIYLCPKSLEWAVIYNGPLLEVLKSCRRNKSGMRHTFLTELIQFQKIVTCNATRLIEIRPNL